MPQSWAVSTASRICELEWACSSSRRSSSVPVSGAIVTDRAPDSASGRRTSATMAGIRSDERATSIPSAKHSSRISAGPGGRPLRWRQTHPVGEQDSSCGLVEDAVGRVTAQPAIVVADPAVAALLRATAGHLNQSPSGVLRIGCHTQEAGDHRPVRHVTVALLDPA